MKLTQQNKDQIDKMTYDILRIWWQNAPIGEEPWLRGETGRYWLERMIELEGQQRETPPWRQ